jgi:hypothetical protein
MIPLGLHAEMIGQVLRITPNRHGCHGSFLGVTQITDERKMNTAEVMPTESAALECGRYGNGF